MTEIGIPQQDFFVLFVQDRFAYVVVQTDFESNFILKMGIRDLNSAIEITQKEGKKSWKIGFCCCNGFVYIPITYMYVS